MRAIVRSLQIVAAAALIATVATTPYQPVLAAHREIPPNECPLTGLRKDQKTPPAQKEQTLNEKKNRRTAPADADIDTSVTLAKMLAPGNDLHRFGETKGAEITGFVIDVEQGGHPETANCGNLTEQFTDTHITVGLRDTQDRTETLVVEVTPWWRAAMARQGMDWSTEELKHAIKGKTVKFRGWLMFDLDHVSEAINTKPAHPAKAPWRMTVWEIHPITAMEIVP